jgi:hypothetical protein
MAIAEFSSWNEEWRYVNRMDLARRTRSCRRGVSTAEALFNVAMSSSILDTEDFWVGALANGTVYLKAALVHLGDAIPGVLLGHSLPGLETHLGQEIRAFVKTDDRLSDN